MSILTKIHRKIWQWTLPKYIKQMESCGERVDIKEPIHIDYKYLQMGDDSHILKDARIQNVSRSEKVRIKIGCRTGIQYRFTILAGADVIIGDDVAIASDVFVSSGSHGINPESEESYGTQIYLGEPIVIKDGAWIGEKACILSGVTIGEKSIIGAGSVVTKSIPNYCIAVGNPARIVKKYSFENKMWEKYNE